MKEQLITLETAKLAKEKGFSNGTSDVFIEFSDKSFKEVVNYYTVNNLPACDMSSEDFTVFERPRQGLLQKWLRETHYIIAEARFLAGNTRETAKYEAIVYGEFVEAFSGEEYVDNCYENALEDALMDGLKSIK